MDDASFGLEGPEPTFWTKWLLGVGVPAAAVVYTAVGVLRDRMAVVDMGRGGWGRGRVVWLDGPELWLAGGVFLGLAIVLHAWAFWGQAYCVDHPIVKLPMALGLLLGTGCAVGWAWRWVVHG